MAGRTLRHAVYRIFTPVAEGPTDSATAADEFDESDIWGYRVESRTVEFRKPIPACRATRKKVDKGDRDTAPASLPVSIPDWSKILRDENRGNGNVYNNIKGGLVEEEEEGIGVVIPPHELLWRNRAASLSVHEGIGRTLKGRDLSRVRNAIWEKTGFQD